MKKINAIVIFANAIFWISLVATVIAAASDVVVISHPSVSDEVMTRDSVQQIFLGRKTRWSDGNPIRFVVLKGGDTHETFLRDYIGRTDSQYAMFWKKMVFTGKGRLPTAFDTPEEAAAFVAGNPGAIGYVPPQAATDSVRILPVN